MEFRFGAKEVIVSVLGTATYFAIALLQTYLVSQGADIVKNCVYLPLLFLTVIAAVYGIYPTLIVGITGQLVSDVYFLGKVQLVGVAAVVIFGISIALYSKIHGMLDDKFDIWDAIDFNVIQTMVGVIAWVLFSPLFSYLFLGENYKQCIVNGLSGFLGTTIAIMVIDTLIFFIICAVKQRREAKSNN